MKMIETFMDLVLRYTRDTGNNLPLIGLPTGDYLNLAADYRVDHETEPWRFCFTRTPVSFRAGTDPTPEKTEHRKVRVGPSFNFRMSPYHVIVVMEVKS